MPDGLVTSRALQNEATGIDLQVPLYQEIRGSMMTGHVEYQIVVVSRLAAFKSPKHRPTDVVQLVVSKKYSEIDEFYCKLLAQHPNISLPAMPRKALFVGESDIRERRAAFDELLKFISRNPTLATSPELLDFLGAKTTDVADFNARNMPDHDEDADEGLDFFGEEKPPVVQNILPPKVSKPTMPARSPEPSEEEEEEELDPLGIMRSMKPKPKKAESLPINPAPNPTMKPTAPSFSLFDEEVDPDEDLFQPSGLAGVAKRDSSAKAHVVKLFENPDLGGAVRLGDSLLLPTAYTDGGAATVIEEDEDVEELFRVEEDLKKLLTMNKDGIKPPTAPKPKPLLAKKPTPLSQSSPPTAHTPENNVQSMDQMDILKYIQQNEDAASEDLDLF